MIRTLFLVLTIVQMFPFAALSKAPAKVVKATVSLESDWATTAEWVPKNADSSNPYELAPNSLPPKTTIDTFGICYGASAATVLNYEMCKQGKISDCSKLPESQQISTLGIARYAGQAVKGGFDDYDDSYNQLPGFNMKVTDAKKKGIVISGAKVLSAAADMDKMPTEKCVSLSRIASKIPVASANDAVEAQAKIWSDLKAAYDGYRQALTDKCEDCASKYYSAGMDAVNKGLKLEDDQLVDPNLKNDQMKLLQAFKEDTYEKALNTLLYPKECSEKGISLPDPTKVKVEHFPQKEKIANGYGLIDKIKEILKSKKPAVLDGICVWDCGNQPKYHSAVVAGYRKICPKGDVAQKNCREAIKVINSAGAGWQAAHNDGWVDAKSLLKNVTVVEGSLSWLQDRQQTADANDESSERTRLTPKATLVVSAPL